MHRASVPGSAGLRAVEAVSGLVWVLLSFIVIYWLCQFMDLEGGTWVVLSLWVLSGLAVLWSPIDGYLARAFFGVRQPTLVELERMAPSWMAAAARAGAMGPRYSLWIEETDQASAVNTGGYTVAISRWALYTLPPSHLEAVLARELMTHPRGGTWLARLANWYALPARTIALVARLLLKLSRTIPAVGCTLVGFVLAAYLGLILVALVYYDSLLVPLAYLTPLFTPLIFVVLRRWNERMADRAAADLGYGQRMIEVLYGWQAGQQKRANAGQIEWLSSVQTSVSDRIRALELYQQRR